MAGTDPGSRLAAERAAPPAKEPPCSSGRFVHQPRPNGRPGRRASKADLEVGAPAPKDARLRPPEAAPVRETVRAKKESSSIQEFRRYTAKCPWTVRRRRALLRRRTNENDQNDAVRCRLRRPPNSSKKELLSDRTPAASQVMSAKKEKIFCCCGAGMRGDSQFRSSANAQ